MLYFLMFLQIGTMFYALKLHKRRQTFANILPAGIAVQIFGIGAVFVAILKISLMLFGGNNRNEEIRKEVSKTEFTALWYLGNYIANQHPGKKITLLVAPPGHADSNQKNRIDGFNDGVNGRSPVGIVEVPFSANQSFKLNPGEEKLRSYNYENLNNVLVNQTDMEILVTLIGLPKYYYEMEFWNNKNFPLLYVYRGSTYGMGVDIKEDKISGLVVFNPRKRFKADAGQKVAKAESFFNEYFLFIDKNNLAEMAGMNPALLLFPVENEEVSNQ